ncbi:MAG: pantetheine-phosphate adenylyltransferase [Bacteroidetes bacterium]|nr:pantetheine-phosphate adenylyltransferase [Bacteroidota bacterium]
MTKRIAVYPGTLFDKIIVLVARNSSKAPLFSGEERVTMIREVFRKNIRVTVDIFDGLLVEYVVRKKATAIIRGLRAVSDFEFEFQMALTNRKMNSTIDTVFLVPDERFTYLNSSIVREIARLGGDVSDFVPASVRRRLIAKVKSLSRR